MSFVHRSAAESADSEVLGKIYNEFLTNCGLILSSQHYTNKQYFYLILPHLSVYLFMYTAPIGMVFPAYKHVIYIFCI